MNKELNMEKYKSTLKKRIALFAALFLLSVVLFGFATFRSLSSSATGHIAGFFAGVQSGGFLACALVLALFCVRYIQALSHPEKLKKMYIEETDERTQLIQQKIGGIAYTVFNFLLILATIFASYFSVTVAFSIFGVTLAFTALRAGLKLYYLQKY